jgi:nicotinamide mononucleotide adenylyltransferase
MFYHRFDFPLQMIESAEAPAQPIAHYLGEVAAASSALPVIEYIDYGLEEIRRWGALEHTMIDGQAEGEHRLAQNFTRIQRRWTIHRRVDDAPTPRRSVRPVFKVAANGIDAEAAEVSDRESSSAYVPERNQLRGWKFQVRGFSRGVYLEMLSRWQPSSCYLSRTPS